MREPNPYVSRHTTPEALAEAYGWSPRRVRKFARELGACRVIGNRMILTDDDVKVILEASKQTTCRCLPAIGGRAMSVREIAEDQAQAVRRILEEECGLRPDDGLDGFVWTVTTPGKKHICEEYRFMGALGFGGKFRNNGNHNNTPYVDCYPEHETPERLAMIKRANTRLAELFADASPQSGKGQ